MNLKKIRRFFKPSKIILVGLLCVLLVLVIIWVHPPKAGPTSGFEQVDKTKHFSVVVLPDTQKYSKDFPDIFCNQTQWIVDNKDKLNIALVSQLGDIVDSGAKSKKEWERASACMSKLQGIVPWAVLAGNHDTDVVNKNSSGFSTYDTYFPKSLFDGMSWYKEGFRNNQNSFVSIEVLGIKIGLISLSIEPDDEVLKWANGVVEKNKDHLFLFATHKYLVDENGKRDEGLDFSKNGNDGEMLWHKFVKKHCEVRLVLSGHFHKTDGEDMRIDKNDCGKDVLQTIQDYQAREKGGNGRLRVYTFTPKEKMVEVKTYSPYTDTFEIDADSEFEFKFN